MQCGHGVAVPRFAFERAAALHKSPQGEDLNVGLRLHDVSQPLATAGRLGRH
jgi:hypothetical protein